MSHPSLPFGLEELHRRELEILEEEIAKDLLILEENRDILTQERRDLHITMLRERVLGIIARQERELKENSFF